MIRQWIHSGIFRKIILAILVVSLIPQTILGLLALRSISDAGATSIARSREALDAKSAGALELRAVEAADAIARFLEEREADLRTLAYIPRANAAYLAFYQAHQEEAWHVPGVMDAEEAAQGTATPVYREIAYVDAAGQEVVSIVDGSIIPQSALRDVSDPANTTYRSETYFAETRDLAAGDIYVGHVTGYHVSREEFEAGVRYEGVLRFAMPVFDDAGDFDGIVVLALDSRHLAAFTDHIMPTEQRYTVEPDASTGNYAYLIDDEGYAIAHPSTYLIRGLDEDGRLLPYATRPEDVGVTNVRVDQLGFADENLASLPGLAAQGNAGSIQYYWAEHDKFAAYAPIPYYGGAYDPPGGFGWVGIGADVAAFHEAATLVGDAIQAKVASLIWLMLIIGGVTMVVVVGVAGFLAQQIAAPIGRVTEAARLVEQGDFRLEVLAPLLASGTEDEVVRLARVFNAMADQVRQREQSLKRQIEELRIEINEVRRAQEVAEITETEYFRQLQKKAMEIRKKGRSRE